MKFTLKLILFLIVFFALSTFSFALETATVHSSVEFIVDFSDSMNEIMGDKSKIQTAREIVSRVLDEIPGSVNVGLTLYGHRDKDTCDDIERVEGLNRQEMTKKLNDTKPLGRASIALAMKKAVERLKGNNNYMNIILLSDGKENCQGDLLKTVREIKQKYDYRVIIHVIDLRTKNDDLNRLLGVSQAGYGSFIFPIMNKKEAMNQLSDMVKNFKVHIPKVISPDDMVLIPEGEFLMGVISSEKNPPLYHGHMVYLDAFYIDRHEVTQNQYKTVMGKNPSFWMGSDLPVDTVSWFDAKEFCEKAGKRLPTEAEWEKAAKGGRDDRWAGTSDLKELWKYAWLNDVDVGDVSGGRTHPVGVKKPNGYGLYDMSGNLAEWTADWHSDDYYRISPKKNPKGPDKGIIRTRRGGYWDHHWLGARTTFRWSKLPDTKYTSNGFRCARDANPVRKH